MNAQGVETTAAFGATQRVWTYVRMAAMALGAAGSAMAVQNIGAGQWSRIGQIMTMGIVFNLVLTGGLIVLVLSTDRQALSLFLAGDGQTMVIAQHILKLRTWG